MKMPKKSLKKAPMIIVGGLGAKLVKNVSKKMITNPTMQKFIPVVPLVLGAFLAESAKTENIGLGMIAVGGSDSVGSFVPALAGLEDMDLSGIFGDDEMSDSLNDDVSGTLDDDVSGTLDDDVSGYEDY